MDYFDSSESVKDYMAFLRESGWTAITYTTSTYNPDPYDELTELGEFNAHGVIGQEFSKVVFVMDKNFRYSGNGKLQAKNSYYSASGIWVWYLLVRFEVFWSFFCFRGKNAGVLFAFLYAAKNTNKC